MSEAAVDQARDDAPDRSEARCPRVERAIREYFDELLSRDVAATEEEIASIRGYRAVA